MFIRTLVQRIIGLSIFAVGLKLLNDGLGMRVCLTILVVGILIALNTPRKKKEEEEDDDW